MVISIDRYDDVDVFIGLDVGKGEHHAVALDRTGKRLFDKALPNDEARLRAVLDQLAGHGLILVVVDQPATIGALPVAVAQACGALVGYLPGLAMRRIADLHPDEAKTDARDAAIIAETARTMPHTLRSIQVADEQVAELSMLCGFDDDLAGQITQVSNRIRGLLTQIHPALERVLGPRLDHPAILDLLQHYPSPAAMRAAGEKRLAARLLKNAPRKGQVWATAIMTALGEQTFVATGSDAAALVLPRLAEQLASLRRQRDEIADSGHARQDRGERVLFDDLLDLSAFAALRDPESRTYYDRKIAQGKRHNQALIALARRRADVLFEMLRDGTSTRHTWRYRRSQLDKQHSPRPRLRRLPVVERAQRVETPWPRLRRRRSGGDERAGHDRTRRRGARRPRTRLAFPERPGRA